MSFFDTQNPGLGGLKELTSTETALVTALAALGDPNVDRILFWDDSAGAYAYLAAGSGLTITGTTMTASSSPSGTINEIAYFDSASSIASLAVATYPSLTELAYVKGVTSAIQTQLTAKYQSGSSPTFGTITTTASIELGHASDTTLARVSAGVVSIEGKNIYMAGGTDVAVADGGTGLSSFTAHNVLTGGSAGTALGSVAPGTSGNVLTSDGTDWTSAAPAGGGSTVPTMKMTTLFETAARFGTADVAGSGSNTFTSSGLEINTGASATSQASTTTGANFNAEDLKIGNVIWSSHLYLYTFTIASATASAFLGVGAVSKDGTGHTFTDDHMGFKILKASAAVNLYATQANGTTETASAALQSMVENKMLDVIFQKNGTSSIDYYFRYNNGALSSATNLTTNMPSAVLKVNQWSVCNESAAFTFRLAIISSSYER